MPRPVTPKKVKPGDLITARMWNELRDLVMRADLNTGLSSGLDFLQTQDGTAIRVRGLRQGFLAVAHGAITARSGSTPGSGNVYRVTLSGTSYSTIATDIPVHNPSSNTMTSGNSIDDGQYCWVEEYPSGRFCVSPLECA